nr:SOS response-associated peptidase [Dermatophilus congolensis]
MTACSARRQARRGRQQARRQHVCGRYAATATNTELVTTLKADVDMTGAPVRTLLASPQEPPAGAPDENVAPTKNARVVVERLRRAQTGELVGVERSLRLLTWGLVPSWSKDPRSAVSMINARAESVLTKPAFRQAVRSRRCLVPADCWYEWGTALAGSRQRKPLFSLRRADGAPLTFGGFFEFWRDPEVREPGPLAWVASFSIITHPAQAEVEHVHPRQPLVIEPQDWDAWLDPRRDDAQSVLPLLSPPRQERFVAEQLCSDRDGGNAGELNLFDYIGTGQLGQD